MEYILAGTELGGNGQIWIFIVSGVVLAGLIAFTVVSNILKKKKSGGKGKRRK